MTRVTAGRGKRVRKAEIPKAPDLTREQRIALGKAARAEVPRSSHAEFTPAPQRPDPVALLENQGTARVPELLPIRYGRMAVSAFTVREFASTYADQNERDHRALVDAIASGPYRRECELIGCSAFRRRLGRTAQDITQDR